LDFSPPIARPVVPASTVSLRERQKPLTASVSSHPESILDAKRPAAKQLKLPVRKTKEEPQASEAALASEPVTKAASESPPKKLPRVILRVGPNPASNDES